jgi:hypothetical protein
VVLELLGKVMLVEMVGLQQALMLLAVEAVLELLV